MLSIVAIYIADKIVSQFIKEEGYGRFKKFLFPEKQYKAELNQVILETIGEFEKTNNTNLIPDKFPFYHSKILFDILNRQVLFKNDSSNLLVDEFRENPNIILPTNEQLKTFYKIFIEKVNDNTTLKRLYFDENYKNEIFKISDALGKLIHINKQILEKVTNIDANTTEQFKEIKNIIAGIQINKEAIDLSSLIENITALRNSNRHYAVIELLEKFKETKWTGLTDELKWKTQINLGQTYFDLNEYKKAGEYFIDLVKYDYKKNESKALASLGYAIIGDKVNANKLALESIALDKNLVNAYLALLIVSEINNTEDINNLIPDDIKEKPEIAFSIAGTYLRLEKYDEAIKLFEDIINNSREESLFKIETHFILASAKYKSLNLTDKFNYENLDDTIINSLNSILAIYKKIWDYYKDTDLRKTNWYVLTNIGIVNKILGNISIAEANFKESLEINKNYFTYFNLLLLKLDDKIETQRLINEIELMKLTFDENCQFLIIKADFLLNENHIPEAIKLLVDNIDRIKGSIYEIDYYSILIETLLKNEDIINAKVYLSEQLSNHQDKFIPNYLDLEILLKEGNINIEDQLKKTIGLLTNVSPTIYYLKIADIYFKLNDFRGASEILIKIANLDNFNFITQNLLNCYYQIGNYEKGINLAERLFSKYKKEPYLADYLSVIYEKIGEFDKAINVIKIYLQVEPNDSIFKTKLSINYCKKGEFTNGLAILNTIQEIHELPTEVQFFIANAYIQNGEYEKGMEIAYKLRQKHYSDPKIHEKYLMLNTNVNGLDKKVFFPETVKVNTHVTLFHESKGKIEYTLSDSPLHNEIDINEPTGKNLIGKKINDPIIIGNDDYKVISIMSKYTYAFQESISLISTRFSDQDLNVKVFNTVDKNNEFNFQPIFNIIDEAESYSKEVDKLYQNRTATIGSNASLLHENPIRYWGKITSNSDMGLYSIGPIDEYLAGKDSLKQNASIVIDIVSLLTLLHLDIFHLLSVISNNIYVTKTTIKNIEDQIASVESNIDSDTTTVGKIGKQYVRNDVTVDQKNVFIANLTNFLSLVRHHCKLADSVLSSDYPEKKKIDEVLGESFNDTVLYAQQNNAILFSDDVNFRAIAKSKFEVSGISTFIFLFYLLEKQIISNEEYSNYVASMVKLNYRLVPINPDILYMLFDYTKFRIEQPFVNACDIIRPDILNDIEATVFCIDFLYKVYTQTTAINRDFVCQFILKKYFTGREYQYAKNVFMTLLNKKFHLLPLQKTEILSFIY